MSTPPTPTAHTPHATRQPRARAFTLLELLIVIIIIAIVIAIIVPSVGRARDLARTSQTQGLMNSIIAASAQFQQDHGRLPGHFAPRDMGLQSNITRGMSYMENILLDLAGGITQEVVGKTVEVGPFPTGNANNIQVNPDFIGSQASGAKVYLVLDGKSLVPQHDLKQVGEPGNTAPEGERQMPDVVDSFGQPLLAWAEDDTAVLPVTPSAPQNFAREHSGAGQNAARFYWAANAAFLRSTSLGKKGMNQTKATLLDYSLIGDGATDKVASLMGILGNPSFPYRDPNNLNAPPTVPTTGRAKLIFHSAGPDGWFLGSRDRGAKQFDNDVIVYARTFVNAGGNLHLGKDGNPEAVDLARAFDDLFTTGGN